MRLIDADALYYTILNKTKFNDNQDNYIVLDVIDEQPTISQWIPVSERLPVVHEDVLVCTMGGCVHVGWYDEDGEWWLEEHDLYGDVYEIFVSAWMPLPEPYKESDNE